MVQSYWGALLFLIIGYFLIKYNIKNPVENYQLRGWASAIGFVAVGIIIIIFKLMNKM